MTKQEIEGRKNALFSLVKDREAKLRASDYVAAKIAEGAAKRTEYAEVLSGREQARKEINAAEAEISKLEGLEPDDNVGGAL